MSPTYACPYNYAVPQKGEIIQFDIKQFLSTVNEVISTLDTNCMSNSRSLAQAVLKYFVHNVFCGCNDQVKKGNDSVKY